MHNNRCRVFEASSPIGLARLAALMAVRREMPPPSRFDSEAPPRSAPVDKEMHKHIQRPVRYASSKLH